MTVVLGEFNAESSCIGLIFTSNQSLVMDSRVYQCLHLNYHQPSNNFNFIWKFIIHHFEREIWRQSSVAHIRNAIKTFLRKMPLVTSTRRIWSLYLTKQSKIFYLTTFIMKFLFEMIEIRLGLTKKSKQNDYKFHIQNKVENLQNQLALSMKKINKNTTHLCQKLHGFSD